MAVTANPHGSWSERNIADIAECLDIAFANVLEFEFGRLTAGMSRSQIDDWLGRSERSIQRLRKSSDMPDYSDCMVVLRYVIPYQLSHINLAYTVIKDSENGSSLTNAGAMRMVDFGAGCLAMSFAVALAVADALDRGERIRAVHLDSIDINRPMMDLGVKLWNEFVHVVSNQQKMERLIESARMIQQPKFHHSHNSVPKIEMTDCWISALHTLYDGGESVIKSALSDLCNTLEPNRIFLTCHPAKAHLANSALPGGFQWACNQEPKLRFSGRIDNSKAARVAFNHGFKPPTWNVPRLYTNFSDVAIFASTVAEEDQRARDERRRVAVEHERLNGVRGQCQIEADCLETRQTEEEQRIKEERRREAQEQERRREARRQRDRERRRMQREEQETQRKQQEAELLSGPPGAQGQQSREQTRWQRIQEEARQRREQERQQRQQEEARRHSEPAGAGSSRQQRSGSRRSESSNTGASGGFGRRVLQRVRAWLNPPKA